MMVNLSPKPNLSLVQPDFPKDPTLLPKQPQAATPLLAKPRKLSFTTKLFFAFGHVFNDMIVSIWFSYTLLFFNHRLSGALPGILLLLGQVADAVCSPLVGYASDRCATLPPFARFGRRKLWHFFGVCLSLFSVPLLYNRCFLGEDQPEAVQFAYYATLVVLFQGAWAATQVTHVALINDLTPHQNERISLGSYRQAATMLSNVLMYGLSYLCLRSVSDNAGVLRDEDLIAYTILAKRVCYLGAFITFFFYFFVQEPESLALQTCKQTTVKSIEIEAHGEKIFSLKLADDPESESWPQAQAQAGAKPGKAAWSSWFVSSSFWKITCIYTLSRMFVNLTQVFLPLYLQAYLRLPKATLSLIPLWINISSFSFSFAVSFISRRWGCRLSLVIGIAIALLSSGWMAADDALGPSFESAQIYLVAGLLGMTGISFLISSLALNSALIGVNNSRTTAFVFAAMSFFDKSINGVIIAILEEFKPTERPGIKEVYYKYTMVAITGIPALAIIGFVISLLSTKYGRAEPKGDDQKKGEVMAGH